MIESTAILPNFDAPKLLADPYPAYRELRLADPVHLAPGGEYYVTRYDDVAMILSDQRFGREAPEGRHLLGDAARRQAAFDDMIGNWMVFMDPPRHTRLRRLLSEWFLPRRIEAMAPKIQTIADGLLDRVRDNGHMDVISDFAYPLPVMVVSSLLGVPTEDHAIFRDVSRDISVALNSGAEKDSRDCESSVSELMAYFRGHIADRGKSPREDLISHMLAAGGADDDIPEDELVGTCAFLMWAGHETTKNLIGNGLLCLMRDAGQMEMLRGDPELIRPAVEEFLRFESPIQKVCRWTREEIRLGDKTIPGNSLIVAMIGAANRDPKRFSDPDRLDITRTDNQHLALGRGAHHCIGNLLGRIEAQIAINTLLRRLPALIPGPDKFEWQRTNSVRGLEILPVTFDAA